jgi:hypothetical protein
MVQQCAFIDNTSIFCTLCLRTVQVNVYLTELNKGTRMTMHEPRVNRSPICGVPTPTRSRLWTLRRLANADRGDGRIADIHLIVFKLRHLLSCKI